MALVDDDAAILERWLWELSGEREPDAAVVASLEATAAERGWECAAAASVLLGANWAPDLHPRGKDGKFIEKFGMVKFLGGTYRDKLFRKHDLKDQRGQVEDIIPNRRQPGNPDIKVRMLNPDGSPGREVTVKPADLIQAPEKARLNRPDTGLPPVGEAGPILPVPNERFDVPPVGEPLDLPPVTDQELAANRRRLPSRVDETGQQYPNRPPSANPDPRNEVAPEALPTLNDRDLNDLIDRLDKSGDNDLLLNQAIDERDSRPARPSPIDQRRAALIADINTAAADLSTTDAQERANGLDEILAKLRFSIIDTDQVHDRISPPEGDSGRWTPERHAQHEAMWEELLASVEQAGIPKDHDAFVLGGLPGAGKSSALRPGGPAAQYGVQAWEPNTPVPASATHVSINPDIVKEMLIDRGMLPEGITTDLKPMEQVTFIHEESSYLGKLFAKRLSDEGYNIVLDNTMDSPSGMLKRMTPLAEQGYSFRALFVDIPVEESLASTKLRYANAALSERGGRFVPSSVMGNRASTKSMSKNRDAMDDLVAKDWFTEWSVVDNTGIMNRTPRGEVTASGTGKGTAAARWRGDLTPGDAPSGLTATPALFPSGTGGYTDLPTPNPNAPGAPDVNAPNAPSEPDANANGTPDHIDAQLNAAYDRSEPLQERADQLRRQADALEHEYDWAPRGSREQADAYQAWTDARDQADQAEQEANDAFAEVQRLEALAGPPASPSFPTSFDSLEYDDLQRLVDAGQPNGVSDARWRQLLDTLAQRDAEAQRAGFGQRQPSALPPNWRNLSADDLQRLVYGGQPDGVSDAQWREVTDTWRMKSEQQQAAFPRNWRNLPVDDLKRLVYNGKPAHMNDAQWREVVDTWRMKSAPYE